MNITGSDWIYTNDSRDCVKQGETISVWMSFVGSAAGIAAFGFGESGRGAVSLVASPISRQLLLTTETGLHAATLGVANVTFRANHWYRMEVSWDSGDHLTGRLYDSNGTTVLQTISGSTSAMISGGNVFKASGKSVAWDTVQVSPGSMSLSCIIKPFAASDSSSESSTEDSDSLYPSARSQLIDVLDVPISESLDEAFACLHGILG